MATVQLHTAFWNNCPYLAEKQLIYKCFQKPQISSCHNQTLYSDVSSTFQKNNFKVNGSAKFLGGPGGKQS